MAWSPIQHVSILDFSCPPCKRQGRQNPYRAAASCTEQKPVIEATSQRQQLASRANEEKTDHLGVDSGCAPHPSQRPVFSLDSKALLCPLLACPGLVASAPASASSGIYLVHPLFGRLVHEPQLERCLFLADHHSPQTRALTCQIPKLRVGWQRFRLMRWTAAWPSFSPSEEAFGRPNISAVSFV